MNFIGFHGTTETNANNIIQNKEFQFDKNPHIKYKLPNDLGFGAYFFISDETVSMHPQQMALSYVQKYKNCSNNYSILKVDIETDNYLDLDNKENSLILDEYRTSIMHVIEEVYTIIKKKHPNFKNYRYNLDGLLIELMIDPHQYLKPWLHKSKNSENLLRELNELSPLNDDGVLIIPDAFLKRTFTNINSFYKVSSIPNGRELCLRNNNCINNIKKMEDKYNE